MTTNTQTKRETKNVPIDWGVFQEAPEYGLRVSYSPCIQHATNAILGDLKADARRANYFDDPCKVFFFAMRLSGAKYSCRREPGLQFRACIDGECHTGTKITAEQTWFAHPIKKRTDDSFDGSKGWHEWGGYQIKIDQVPVYSYGFDVVDGNRSSFFHRLHRLWNLTSESKYDPSKKR